MRQILSENKTELKHSKNKLFKLKTKMIILQCNIELAMALMNVIFHKRYATISHSIILCLLIFLILMSSLSPFDIILFHNAVIFFHL